MSWRFTRVEFYDLVWSKPMTHLAKEFAISDVALHKICKKHDVPNPPLGWWAKKAAGKKVSQTPLPKPKAGISDTVTIVGGELARESPALRKVRDQARIAASGTLGSEPKRLVPIIEKTIGKLRAAKPGPTGLVSVADPSLVACEVAPASIDRLHEALNRIASAAALQGFEIVNGEASAHFQGPTASLAFSVKESVKRSKHELTPDENTKLERWQRKQGRDYPLNWAFFNPLGFAEWDYKCTGQLSFELEHVYVRDGLAPRKSFRDAKVQRLENMASEIAVGLAVLASAKVEAERRREEAARQAEEARFLRDQAQRAQHVTERRKTSLDDILGQVEHAERMHRLVDALAPRLSNKPGPRVAELIRWSREYLERLESHLTPAQLEGRFERERLFGDDDDHGFYPRGW